MGYPGPDVDAELIIMCARMWHALGLSRLVLELNSLGSRENRQKYRKALVNYFSAVKSKLDEDSIRRLEQNPLRILDSKNPDMRDVIADAPIMLDFLDDESDRHFAELKTLLDAAGIGYNVNPKLVRGLDYYNGMTFEIISDNIGSQNALCGGGRYDSLVQYLGGKPTPAVGFAAGLERLILILKEEQEQLLNNISKVFK